MPITWPFFMFMIRLDANRQPGREVTNDVEGRSANLDWMWAERPSRNPTGPRPAECWAHEWSPAPTAPETRNRRRVKKSSRTIEASLSRPRVVAAVELDELPAQSEPRPGALRPLLRSAHLRCPHLDDKISRMVCKKLFTLIGFDW